MSKQKNILYVHYGSDWIRGSERCVIDLIKHIDRARFTPFLWTNCEPLHNEMGKLHVHSELSAFPLLLGERAPKFDLVSWRALVTVARRYIRDAHIDLIHVNSAAPCQWMCLAASLEGVELITQVHSDYPARERLTLCLHRSPHIIAVSDAVTHNLRKDGYPSEQLSVVHNGIDVSRLESQTEQNVKGILELDDDAYLFATVGSLISRKGIDRIISALRYITLEYPNTHLVVIGDGPLRQRLESTAEYYRLEKHIHFVGEQPNVFGWLKGCDAFVSGARQEAFGLVIAEAALAELPIVAPEEGGIKEIVTHQKNALLYPNSGIKGLVKCMRAVRSNPNSALELALNARSHVLSHHTIAHNTRNIEAIYLRQLMAKQTRSPSLWRTLSPLKTFVTSRITIGG